MTTRLLAALLGLVAAALLALALWNPYPRSGPSFDRAANGIWLGHKWYTGREVRSGALVPDSKVDALVESLRERGTRSVFLHAGPIQADGSLPDAPGPTLKRLRRLLPDVTLYAWLGARLEKVALSSPLWRMAVVASVERVAGEGFDGVHFNLEPTADGDPAYLALLDQVRAAQGADFRISQATPRSGPYGVRAGLLPKSFWSGSYYRETMQRTDQTVLMAYDAGLPLEKAYVGFVRHETILLSDWACAIPGHELLIGIPSYEDVAFTDPEIENIRTAALGVRSALEALGAVPPCFAGVAVYANWVTDAQEWEQYERYWRGTR